MTNPYITSDINLAAALAACGIPLYDFQDGSPPFAKVQSKHGTTYNFYFEHESNDGLMTVDLVAAWYDATYIDANPEEPFAYIKAYHDNKNALIDLVKKASSIVIIEKGRKFALISSNAPEDIKQSLFKNL